MPGELKHKCERCMIITMNIIIKHNISRKIRKTNNSTQIKKGSFQDKEAFFCILLIRLKGSRCCFKSAVKYFKKHF